MIADNAWIELRISTANFGIRTSLELLVLSDP